MNKLSRKEIMVSVVKICALIMVLPVVVAMCHDIFALGQRWQRDADWLNALVASPLYIAPMIITVIASIGVAILYGQEQYKNWANLARQEDLMQKFADARYRPVSVWMKGGLICLIAIIFFLAFGPREWVQAVLSLIF